MAEIVNLRIVRKRKASEQNKREAEANRALYGQTKTEKQAAKLQNQRHETNLNGHLRQPSKP